MGWSALPLSRRRTRHSSCIVSFLQSTRSFTKHETHGFALAGGFGHYRFRLPLQRTTETEQPWVAVAGSGCTMVAIRRARDYWVASTANHRCLVWNLNLREDSSSGAVEHSLQGHSRAITDINFSAHHPDLLATCSVDGYVHNWDLRRPRQPVLTFCDWFAGATQVKYSRQDPHVLASSHDRWLHIWDDRKPAEPLKSISAHTSKIYGLDWNRTKATSLVTCSLDKSIKFWDYEKDDDAPNRTIRTDFPVWRARSYPVWAWSSCYAANRARKSVPFMIGDRPPPSQSTMRRTRW